MKLLIITQVIDSEHPILGFFHRWVEEFAKHCEVVHVICLQAGKHSLPANVIVHSLGKEQYLRERSDLKEEQGDGERSFLKEQIKKIRFTIRFYKLIWQLRHEYDNVFVHMNQIYIILGAPFWRAAGKKIGLWYMHGSTSRSLKLAEKLTDKIFTGSPESFRIKSDKVLVTGHGIDTERFAPQTAPKNLDLITVGRITESKNLLTLVAVLAEVRKSCPIALTIVGGVLTPGERAYEAVLKARIETLNLTEAVTFIGRVPQADLPTVLSQAKVFVTAAQNGSLDKAMLEAMACGLPIVSMAPGSVSLPLGAAQVRNSTDFVRQLSVVLESGVFNKQDYVHFVQKSHSLQSLVPKIISSYGRDT